MSQNDITRRDVVKVAGAATAAVAVSKIVGAPRIQKVRAANNQVVLGVIGTGGRGQYHLTHLNGIDTGRVAAVCDIFETNLQAAIKISKDKPQGYKDYHELLARQDIDAVLIATPLYTHFPITKDALLAGKHVFCEKSLVFKPEEVHELRALSNSRPKQVLQVGLQRRYSKFYQTAKEMIQKGILGEVTNMYAQWNRNPGWPLKQPKPGQTLEQANWRLYRKFSGGLVAELASHQIDIADWMFGAQPEFVVGVGGLDFVHDGRDVYDNIQLILKYPKGQKLTYSSICTNKHLSMFQGTRTEFGECIMGTKGTIEITVGTDKEPAIGLWYYEPGPTVEKAAAKKEIAQMAGATLASTGRGSRAMPILFDRDQVSQNDSFLQREMKFARRWLYAKGVMVPEEDQNPVDVQLESFFDCCRTGKHPLADLEIGLADSTMVILANKALDEGRRVNFNEINTMGVPTGAKTAKS
ncbi:MAG: Gfo/Idh/MocA family oxidoreductase [Bryobacterales bacterium]|nr:Gfo/Idh/MocA family oxidoreductase [Bryobacterales bacterium]